MFSSYNLTSRKYLVMNVQLKHKYWHKKVGGGRKTRGGSSHLSV